MRLPWKLVPRVLGGGPASQLTHGWDCEDDHCDDRHRAWTALRAAYPEIQSEWTQAYADEAGTRLIADLLHLDTQFGGSAAGLLDNALKVFESEPKSGMALTGNWR
jgi:hypothetical protein